ncbi:MAG: biotin--[acetyl-CoA-carboxylase] ligase [Bacillota bacterium]|nr:biotin--[acetyl-CoA-carboxylase] ligase [Bacillota bacterium]
MKEVILNYLKDNENKFISGEEISSRLNITRASVWKYINSLKNDGYQIESVSRKGYKLTGSPDILTYEEIQAYLKTSRIGRKIIYKKSIDSTNSECRRIADAESEGTAVVGEEQLKGRGRLGRTWTSPLYKGIFMSIILKPDIDMEEAPKITSIGAAAVFLALKDIGIECQVKWPNDVVINGKKVCGILTEMSGEINRINYIVIGIGINVNLNADDIPEDLKDKATSLLIEKGKNIDRRILLSGLLNHFENLYDEFLKGDYSRTVSICRDNSSLVGKEVRIIKNGKEAVGKAIDIGKDGALIIEYKNGEKDKIISGEVSVRGIGSYS